MAKSKTKPKVTVKKKAAVGKTKSKTVSKVKGSSKKNDSLKSKKKVVSKKISLNGKASGKKSKPAKVTKAKITTKSKVSTKKIGKNGKASAAKKSKSSSKGKSKYSARDLKYFKQIILDERKQILESAKANMEALVDHESGEYVGDNSTYSTHMAEQGTDEMEREKNYLFVQRDEKYLGYLNEALIRIDNGTYGICINCKKLIMKERLELVPITQHCIVCKTMKG